jgi:hypothetical protein
MNNLDKIQMDTDITYSLVSIYQAQLKKCKDKKEINYRLFLKKITLVPPPIHHAQLNGAHGVRIFLSSCVIN